MFLVGRLSMFIDCFQMNGLYILDCSIVIALASMASQTSHDKIKLWHLRLGYVNERGLVELEKQNLLNGNNWTNYNIVIIAYWVNHIELNLELVCMFLVDHLGMFIGIFGVLQG